MTVKGRDQEGENVRASLPQSLDVSVHAAGVEATAGGGRGGRGGGEVEDVEDLRGGARVDERVGVAGDEDGHRRVADALVVDLHTENMFCLGTPCVHA